jgi:spore germination protein
MRRLLIAAFLVAASADAGPYRFSTWVVPFDSASLRSIEMHGGKVNEINPVWLMPADDGSVKIDAAADDPTWRAAMVGARVIPTIQNDTMGKMGVMMVQTILETPALRDRHIDDLVTLVVNRGWDGVEIDYEWIMTSHRAHMTDFLSRLGARLDAAGKELVVCLHPKTYDTDRNGPGSQDWNAIGRIADRVKIMLYGFHWSTSDPGPLAPLDWIENVAEYASETLPAERTVFALPWYGYDWKGMDGDRIFFEEARALAMERGIAPARDANGELMFTYRDHVVYFQDAQSFRMKMDAVTRAFPNPAGFAMWRPGGEDPEKWEIVDQLRIRPEAEPRRRAVSRAKAAATAESTPMFLIALALLAAVAGSTAWLRK